MPRPNGKLQPAVVLVADRTLSADYRILFEGIFATMQTTQVPAAVMRRFIAPPVGTDAAGRAAKAPLGLRRIESSLLAETNLTDDVVVVTTPEALPTLLGPWTRLLAVSSSDPLGRGMSNTTTSHFWPGRLYTAEWTDAMMATIKAAKDAHGFRVVAGGGGAWQWLADPDAAARQGIDTVFEGYFESGGPALVTDLLAGKAPPPAVRTQDTAAGAIHPIRGATVMGAVELSRGCGNGCRFCTMARRPMRHLPPETILADVQTNVAAGVTAVVAGSEDVFRYGGSGGRVNFQALRDLLVGFGQIEALRFVQLDHANIASVAQLSDAELAETRRLIPSRGVRHLWVNLGAESANGRLVADNGRGKIGPYRPDDWPDLVRAAGERLNRAGFFPVFSVILGLPGETPDDVAATARLVHELAKQPVAVFPVFHEPVRPDGGQRFTLETMRADHLALFTDCYQINFTWVPRLYRDNQRAGGVSWLKRAAVQALGRVEIRSWRKNFARMGRRIAARDAASASPASAPEPEPSPATAQES